MLTAKQHELIRFIQQRLEETGISPSFEEMKAALDLKSKSGVHRLISALEERGFIRRLPNRARALEILKNPEDALPRSNVSKGVDSAANDRPSTAVSQVLATRSVKSAPANDIVELPLHGRIAAGAPIEAFEEHSSLPVPAALLGPGDHYALEVSGDSMIEAGIFDGDYALIKRTETARDGEIVVALVDNEEATLKYMHHEGGNVRLDPANANYAAQVYNQSQVQVQGRLAGLLRRYH
ncbi:MAG: transcriptional repressor LexA [Pontixanthobacter sp.]